MASRYVDCVSCTYQGLAYVFARDTAAADPSTIVFNVLNLKLSSISDEQDWTGFQSIAFPDQVRPVGMSLIQAATAASDKLRPAAAPFRVVSDDVYLYFYRQSVGGTLLVSRMRATKSFDTDTQSDRFSIVPAWEVRFRQSGKVDVPGSDQDVQSYLAPDGQPFLEPTLELWFVNKVADGRFDVALLPGANANRWHIFACDAAAQSLRHYALAADPLEVFLLTDQTLDAQGFVQPRDVITLQTKDGAALPLTFGPTLAVYAKREPLETSSGDQLSAQRSARLALAQPVQKGEDVSTALLDFGVGTDGQIVQVSVDGQPAVLKAPPIQPANYDLDFDTYAYVSLPNAGGSLEIKGAFEIDLWLRPTDIDPPVQQIIGDDEDDPAKRSVFLEMIDGGKVALGFGTGATAVRAVTPAPVLRENAWSRLHASFTLGSPNTLALLVNGAQVPLQDATTAESPRGAPVTRISRLSKGFIGGVDNPIITSDGKVVAHLPFDLIDYNTNPPTTPDTSGVGNNGGVYGARLEPSDAPVVADRSGDLLIDSKGLRLYYGLLDFVKPASTPALLSGHDGLLHLYFQGPLAGEPGLPHGFDVAQFQTRAARAAFVAPWNAQPHGMAAETGQTPFVARMSGSFMNSANVAVTVGPPPDGQSVADLCDVEFVLAAAAGGELSHEVWKGAPRRLEDLQAVLTGLSSAEPSDASLQLGGNVFFDPTGRYQSARVPLDIEQRFAFLNFVSLQPERLPLRRVEISGDSAARQVVLRLEATKAAWPEPKVYVQTWTALPPQAGELQRVLAAVADKYDYAVSASGTVPIVPIHTSARQGTGRVAVLVHPSLTKLTMAIEDDDTPSLCKVTVTGDVGGVPKSAVYAHAPRDPASFALVLDGDDPAYDYAAFAQGDYKEISARLLPFAESLPAQVLNRPATEPLAPADMKAGASLFALFQSGGPAASAIVPQPFAQDALARTSAVDGKGQILTTGSRLFALPPSPTPMNGGAPLIASTADTGAAPLSVSGVDGGWILEPPQKALGFSGQGEIRFDAAAPNTDRVFLDRDMTIEAWFNPSLPDPQLPFSAPQRILTFNRVGKPGDPHAVSQYALGASGAYTLKFDKRAYALKGLAPLDHVASLEIWVMPDPVQAGDVMRAYSSLPTTEVLGVKIVGSGLTLSYCGSPSGITPVPLTPGEWTYVTATVTREDDQVQLRLYINGAPHGHASAAYVADRPIDGFTVGMPDKTAPSLCVNGASFWSRVLTPDEIAVAAQRSLPDDSAALLIRWKFIEGSGLLIHNSAPTGPQNDVTIAQGSGVAWTGPGIYQAYHFARGQEALAGATVNGVGHWRHVAASYRCGTSLHFDGVSGASCRYDDSLTTQDAFSAEVWIRPEAVDRPQVLIEKFGSYVLELYANGTVGAVFNTTAGAIRVTSAERLAAGGLYYVTAVFATSTVAPTPTQEYAPPPEYKVECWIYVNGELKAKASKTDGSPIHMSSPKTGLTVGVAASGDVWYSGWLAQLRLWRRVLDDGEITVAYQTRTAPPSTDGLVSAWSFSEMSGRIASDEGGVNRLMLSSVRLWSLFEPVSEVFLLIDGEPAGSPQRLSAAAFGGYGDQQLTIGACHGSSSVVGLRGWLDDVRLWSIARTREQIVDLSYRELAGNETGLAGYWTFDAGSGDRIEDQTGGGVDGQIVAAGGSPGWGVSRAPLSNEGKEVFNVLGGIDTEFNLPIAGTPTAVEYADVQLDAYGKVFSVLKRCYAAPLDGRLLLASGYYVGELDTVYVGQVQTKPTVIGFIEGAPPLPSENQTAPYWATDFTQYQTYANAASISLALSEQTTYALGAASTNGGAYNFDGKGGLSAGTTLGASAGIGWESDWGFVDISAHIGPHGSIDNVWNSSKEVSLSVAETLNSAAALSPGGDWEPPDRLLNPVVGRRYVPANTGYALVKSGVADLYASRLKSDGTLVRLTAVPNLDIPQDVNILTFPINPLHVKNGTLDGQVGLVKDPGTETSYFRPLEAYSLKRSVERKQQQIESYYKQFDPSSYAQTGGMDQFKAMKTDNPSFDWGKALSHRAVANTYVWTAAGGTFAEETNYADSYSENYGALSSSDHAIGLSFDFDIKAFVGLSGEFDFLWHTTVELTATKSREDQATVQITALASPDGYLSRPIVDGDKITFTAAPAPGKVDAYRYMAFYLPPDVEHFAEFFGEIIDPQWLAESQSPEAVALRQASDAENGCWKVCYYVTYVSRVPPPYQPSPDQVSAPAVTPPANLDQNDVLVKLVDRSLPLQSAALASPGLTTGHPSPAQIGAAVRAVLGDSPAQPGQLAGLLTWWSEYWVKAANYANPESVTLSATRQDVLGYMDDYYEIRAYTGIGRTDLRLLGQRR